MAADSLPQQESMLPPEESMYEDMRIAGSSMHTQACFNPDTLSWNGTFCDQNKIHLEAALQLFGATDETLLGARSLARERELKAERKVRFLIENFRRRKLWADIFSRSGIQELLEAGAELLNTLFQREIIAHPAIRKLQYRREIETTIRIFVIERAIRENLTIILERHERTKPL